MSKSDSGSGDRFRREGMVDVVMPTWNSASRLDRSLSSVVENVRPAGIIVVDRDSSDATRDIAHRYGAKVITDTVSLGSARMKGVKESGSDWVCFVDDDISLPPHFMEEMALHMTEGVGAVQAAVISVHLPYREMLIKQYERRFSGGDHYDLMAGERGLTSATMIRRDLIADLELSDMDTWEDWLITQKIIDSGHRWVVARRFADHFHEFEDLARKGGWNAAGILNLGRTRRMPIMQALRWYADVMIATPKSAVRDTIMYRDPGHFILQTKTLINILAAPIYLLRVVPRKPAHSPQRR